MDNVNDRRRRGAKWLVLLALVGAGVYIVSWFASGEPTHTATDMAPTVLGDNEAAPSTTVPPTTLPPTTAVPATAPTTAVPTTSAAPVSDDADAVLTIAEEISAAGDLSQIDGILDASDVDDLLDGPGPYTVFAPPNISFVEVDRDTLTAISADPALVRMLALNHVVEGDVPPLRALDGPLVTMAGSELIFEVIDDELFIVTAAGRVGVQENRIVATNGVIHGVDGVLLADQSGSGETGPIEDDSESGVDEDPPVDEPEPEESPREPNETVDAIAEILALSPVQFDDSSADIKVESLATLDRVVEILEADGTTRLEVAGHTDDIGPADGNQRWSERRARSVRDYLIGKGVDPDRLVAVGYGENRPIADNATEEGRAENRRIEFTLL